MRLLHIDAFTDQAFRGNPAAVCILDDPRDEKWMQAAAAEMNLSATAFLLPHDDGFALRWFTPSAEIALCGHATLASAHALWSEGLIEGEARFHTQGGLLTATRRDDLIELDFPETRAEKAEAPDGMLEALGIANPLFVGRSKLDYLVETDDVQSLRPDHARLRSLPARGVIVTQRGGGRFDFTSRFFAPGVGIQEDPVTGSAHCCLAPYWAEKLGRREMVAYQASARGGIVRVRLEGDRVKLAGRAVTISRGELVV